MGHLPSVILAVVILPLIISLHSCCAFAFSTQIIARSVIDSNLLHGHAKKCLQYPYNRKHYDPSETILLGHRLDSFGEQDDRGEGVISVTTQRTLPDVTPHEARNAWIEYHWEKGGGLPIAILSKKLHDSDMDDDDVIKQSNMNTDGQYQVLERTILPILMKERLEYGKVSDEKSLDLHYKVTEAGPFFSDLIPGSHSAVVTFDATTSGCVMTWNVTFSTTRWASLYETVTKWTVGTAATTIQEASSTPRLFSAKTTIDSSSISHPVDPVFARKECLDFVFAHGGGLPLLPPIPYGSVLEEGGGSARQNLLRIPPLITESVVDTSTSDGMAEFTYRLNDPAWWTFPFLVHTHIGRVRFTNTESSLIIDWDVEIRPYKVASPMVEKLVEMTVSTLLRNIRVRLTQPNAAVDIYPPRGNSNMLMGGTSFGIVAKDTWLGGVLDAHLSDTRSTMEQTISLFQPWDWGRSGTGDENDCVNFQWTDGHEVSS